MENCAYTVFRHVLKISWHAPAGCAGCGMIALPAPQRPAARPCRHLPIVPRAGAADAALPVPAAAAAGPAQHHTTGPVLPAALRACMPATRSQLLAMRHNSSMHRSCACMQADHHMASCPELQHHRSCPPVNRGRRGRAGSGSGGTAAADARGSRCCLVGELALAIPAAPPATHKHD